MSLLQLLLQHLALKVNLCLLNLYFAPQTLYLVGVLLLRLEIDQVILFILGRLSIIVIFTLGQLAISLEHVALTGLLLLDVYRLFQLGGQIFLPLPQLLDFFD